MQKVKLKFLLENVEENLYDFGFDDDILDTMKNTILKR